jgi:hypothetical protein
VSISHKSISNNVIKKVEWSKYEHEVFAACKDAFPKAIVTKDEKIRGRFSGRSDK